MRTSLLVLFLSAVPLWAAPPDVPKEYKVAPGQLVRIVAKGDKIGYGTNFTEEQAFFDQLVSQPGEQRFVFQALKPGTYTVGFVTVGEAKIVFCTITVTGATPMPPVPPDPPVPPVPPVPPNPSEVTSFRALLVYESGATITSSQYGILYGAVSEKALDAATLGDQTKFGWRRIDKDAKPDSLPAGLKEFWTAAKPKILNVPCVVFQVNNGAPIIELLPATTAEFSALVSKYRGK